MHLQRNATQRNATQRNAYHHYILNNNFKFYIYQFFKAVNFLSAIFGFAKIFSFIKEKQNLCSFLVAKKNHAKGGQSSKTISFCQKEDKAKARFQRKTTPFRIRNSLVKTLSLRGDSRSNPICLDCLDFLRSLAMTILSWSMMIENNFAIFNYAFSFDAFNFEIISRNENYAFDYNKYFCRNGNNRIGKLIRHYEGNARDKVGQSPSNLFSGLLHFIRNDGDGLFSRNDYGGKFIFGFGNNLNFGFLFNRKTKKNKFMSAHSVGKGEQK